MSEQVKKDADFLREVAEGVYHASNFSNPTKTRQELLAIAERLEKAEATHRATIDKLRSYRCAKCQDEGCGFCGRGRQ